MVDDTLQVILLHVDYLKMLCLDFQKWVTWDPVEVTKHFMKQLESILRTHICVSWRQTIKLLQWNLSITTTEWDTSLPSGAHLGGPRPPRWATEGRKCFQE